MKRRKKPQRTIETIGGPLDGSMSINKGECVTYRLGNEIFIYERDKNMYGHLVYILSSKLKIGKTRIRSK